MRNMKKRVSIIISFLLIFNVISSTVFASNLENHRNIETITVEDNGSSYVIVSYMNENNNRYEVYKAGEFKPIYTVENINGNTIVYEGDKLIKEFNNKEFNIKDKDDLSLKSVYSGVEIWKWQYSYYTKSDLVGGLALIISILASFLGVEAGLVTAIGTYMYNKSIEEVYFTEKYRYIIDKDNETMKKERYIYSYENSDRTRLIDVIHTIDNVAWD